MISLSVLSAIAIMMHAKTTDIIGAPSDDIKTMIFIRHYVGTTPEKYIDYWLKDANKIQSQLSADKPTVLYVHGFGANVEEESVRTVAQAYLKRNDHNVLAVDYSKLSNNSYPIVLTNFSHIVHAIETALDDMIKSGFDPRKLHLVGHSLGAQICGYIGREVSFKIPRITGLDPASPGFTSFQVFPYSLSASDADFVDVIHTDIGVYGVDTIPGTINFFPNGGVRVQPGCPKNYTFGSGNNADMCSHKRAWRYYAESLLDEFAFFGVECSSLRNFTSNKCKDNARLIMGYGTPRNARGKAYLVTAARSPFGLKFKGTLSNPSTL